MAGAFGFGDDDDTKTDARYPVTVDFLSYGPWTVPQAFAGWLESAGVVDEFDAFIADRRERGVHGDAMSAFLEGRDDVPADVAEAVDGYADYMDQLFGPPA